MHALLPSLCNKQTLTWLLIRHAPAYNYANYDTFAFYVVWPTPLLRLFYACMYVYMFYVHAHVYTCTVYMYVHTCTCININISFRSLNSQLHGMLSQMSQRIPFQFQLKHNCNDIGALKVTEKYCNAYYITSTTHLHVPMVPPMRTGCPVSW